MGSWMGEKKKTACKDLLCFCRVSRRETSKERPHPTHADINRFAAGGKVPGGEEIFL